MDNPEEISYKLKSIASAIDNSIEVNKSRYCRTLRRMANDVESDPKEVVVLKGPLSILSKDKDKSSSFDSVVDVELEGVIFEGSDYPTLAAKAARSDYSESDVEDFADGDYHVIEVGANFAVDGADPSVGIMGSSFYVDEWDIISVDGLYLENPEDINAVKAKVEPIVERDGGDWTQNHYEGQEAPEPDVYDW